MIHICEPSTTSKEIKWVNKALKENCISSTGGYVGLFEKEFAKKIGTKYAVAVNSGTSALFVALKALEIKKGDEVIVPTFTMIATANAVAQCGATPIFVDAKEDCNINERLIERAITPKTKAIIPAHLYGQPCEMDTIMDIADRYGLYVIEDAAEAHGAKYKGKTVGSIGDMGCFSFYANKIITTGEGGAIVTNNEKLAEEARQIRAFYFPKAGHFWHRKIGYNMRMTSLSAAYGLGQLERWKELIKKRISISEYYTKHLKGLVITPPTKGVYWIYLMRVLWRDKLMKYLADNGVETRTGFIPCHLQPPYKENKVYPIAEQLAKDTMNLPTSFVLTKKDLDKIIGLIKKFYEK